MSPELLLAFVMLISLTLYALTGGADYGGGVWDLFASGPLAAQQRETIAKAIGPIWEANHVWLILVIVILFTAFPAAFAAISVLLHIPLTLLLLGVVLRGSSFTFRTYDTQLNVVQRRWGNIFAISSTITPVLLGIVIGAVSSGDLSQTGPNFFDTYIAPWFKPFPLFVGFFALSLFAYLAAVYLTVDAEKASLKDEFRTRALISFWVTAALAVIVYILSEKGAPSIWLTLSTNWPIHLSTGAAAVLALSCLLKRYFGPARFLAAAQVALVLWGWALGQYPYLVRPVYSIYNAHANSRTLELVMITLALGGIVLLPSFYWLLKIFKTFNFED